jgi:two-component system OmpR family response regulator
MVNEQAPTGPILVVDDDPGILELISTTLARVGYSVRTAASYAEAVASAREHEPALAIIDVELPGPSGYDLLKELRDEFGIGLPVILVSGVRAESRDRVAGLLAGADDYLVKPFDPDELVARVQVGLRHAGTSPQP